MYIEEPLQTYLDDLASSNPTPGGGSTAALSGAMGAALVCMVARLTLGKPKYAEVEVEVQAVLEQAEQLRQRFQQLIQADIAAYGNLSACFKMPRASAEEKAARTQALQQRLHEAALVPLEMAERAVTLAQFCQRIAEIGNVNVLSDIATAATLAVGSANGAAWMVRTNVHALKDQALVATLEQRLDTALDGVAALNQQVAKIVGERV
ncbi:MAG TPA: cyclodeaminase/cyclohydrolase family protein [Ktedonobacteraceae bacterium]|nr:cyclodeaminase/cyclohydrolase family protein [Ktedonobacteraceae bacterium]